MKKFVVYISLLLILPQINKSQTFRDSLTSVTPITQNKIASSFNKLLNTSYFNGKLLYGYNSSKFNIIVKEKFRSTVIKSTINNIKDEQFMFLSGSYNLSPYIKLGTSLQNSLYSGDKRLAINRASYLNSILFINFIPYNKIEITPFGGTSTNEQVGTKDKGYIYGFTGSVNNIRVSDFNINSSANFQNEDISPRKNMLRFIELKVNSKLPNVYTNRIGFQYSQLKKDFYLEADSIIASEYSINNNIQSRNETIFEFEDVLTLPRFTSPFSFNFSGNLYKRDIDRDIRYKLLNRISTSSFDTRIEEIKLKLQSQTNFYFNSINGNIKIGYSQREENHFAKPISGVNEIIFDKKQSIEEQKSNRSQIISLSASAVWKISSKNSLLFSVFHRKFNYDTPSNENFDDRDELLSIVRIQFTHKLNPFLNFIFNVDGTNNHIVYLFAQRSANNNKNKTLKLSSGVFYKGKNISSTNIAEVSANYTTYDFEETIPTQKSFAFRQIAFKDSSIIIMLKNLLFKSYGYIKFSEQGDFNWKNFSGKPVRYLKEIYLEPKIKVVIHKLDFGFGLRYYSLSTFGYTQENERVIQSNYTSIGPLAELNYLIIQRLNIRMYGYYEFISPESNKSVQRANLYLTVDWNF